LVALSRRMADVRGEDNVRAARIKVVLHAPCPIFFARAII
jgi:hypothetical protein